MGGEVKKKKKKMKHYLYEIAISRGETMRILLMHRVSGFSFSTT